MAGELEFQVCGVQGAVYPGHAITLGVLVMRAFASLSEARARMPGSSFPAALESEAIPCAGANVHAALSALDMAFNLGLEDAFAYANDMWMADTSTDYRERRQPGVEQADGLKSQYRELFGAWHRERPQLGGEHQAEAECGRRPANAA